MRSIWRVSSWKRRSALSSSRSHGPKPSAARSRSPPSPSMRASSGCSGRTGSALAEPKMLALIHRWQADKLISDRQIERGSFFRDYDFMVLGFFLVYRLRVSTSPRRSRAHNRLGWPSPGSHGFAAKPVCARAVPPPLLRPLASKLVVPLHPPRRGLSSPDRRPPLRSLLRVPPSFLRRPKRHYPSYCSIILTSFAATAEISPWRI